MKSVSDVPTQNIPPLTDGLSTENKWSVLKQSIATIIDSYVIVDQMQHLDGVDSSTSASVVNPHVSRIQVDHSYAASWDPLLHQIHEDNYIRSAEPPPRKIRKLP